MTTNTQKRPLRFVISGGGTGGHIFPALAIADELRRRHPNAEFLFVGASNRMEMERVPAAGYHIEGLDIMGFDRRRLWRNFKVLWKLARSQSRARRLLRDFRPDIAIGVGGYASGPTLKTAQKMGVPTVLQEQNSYAGVTNKLLAKRAKAICVAYEGMDRFFPAETLHLTGNPVRHNILECTLTPAEAKKALGFDPDKPLVLIVGGSLGARTVNNAIAASLPLLAENGIQALWQTGKNYSTECTEKAAPYAPAVQAMPFISDMATAYRAADLVVSRAGASTISELQLLGKPAILVPSPNVAEDHQTKNALALTERGAAILVPDAEAVEKLPSAIISTISDNKSLGDMHNNVLAMALPDSAAHIADIIEQTISENGKQHK